VRETATGIEVPLHVQPRARRTEIIGIQNGALRIKISAPPVNDAANRAIVDFFSTLLDLPKSRFVIIFGERTRDKVLRIEGISLLRFQERIPAAIPPC